MMMPALILAAITIVGSGCRATAPPTQGPSTPQATAEPSGDPVLGIDWTRAVSVERPLNYQESVPPTYISNHPILRIQGQATMADVVALPHGGFVAVGYVPPDWQPTAWTSPDGTTWAIHPMGTTDFTFPVTLAVGDDGLIVAVGRSGKQPVAWTSVDGVGWQQHSIPVLGDGVAERMTTVVAGARGYVAGGSVGPELSDRHARFWTSLDGSDWQTVPDDPVAFADSEVRAITNFEGGFSAVGVVGTAQANTGAVAWTSSDGVTWTRVDDQSFADGVAVAVVAAPFGGLVAVGSDVDRRDAVAWTSPEGRHWTKATSEAMRGQDEGHLWMTDAVAVGDAVIAIGDFQPLQRATATSWVSRDGTHWDRARTAPVQEQVELYAITHGGPWAIAVGSFGGPDSFVPTVLLTPGR